MSESPFDGRVTRRVKMAANVIDRFRYLTTSLLFSFFISHMLLVKYLLSALMLLVDRKGIRLPKTRAA